MAAQDVKMAVICPTTFAILANNQEEAEMVMEKAGQTLNITPAHSPS